MEDAAHNHLGNQRQNGIGFMIGGFGVTFLVHFAVMLAVVIGTITQSKAIEKEAEITMAPFTPVELIKLGVERPPNALPRISNPAPKTVKEDVVNLANKAKSPDEVVLEKKEDPKPKDAVRVKKKERVNDLLDSLHNPNRPVNDDKEEGRASGVVGGTSLDEAQAHLMNTFKAKIQRAIISQWRVPQTITRQRAAELASKVRISVRISPEGYVVSWRMTRKSEDAQFNAACEDAVRKFSAKSGTGRKLPMPDDPEIRALLVKKGIALTRWKSRF
jgi:outer membrane biosynthesis protein TonB